MSLFENLKGALPNDHSKQSNSSSILISYIQNDYLPEQILDFGCDKGDSFKLLSSELPKAQYTGIDINHYSGIIHQQEKNNSVYSYNNATLPFSDEYFDLVYADQALEHIQKPAIGLAEIARVLKKEGLFIGQTSQFEPYHSFNLWNFTVYGFKQLIEMAGMQLIELRPGIDGLTLMERSYTGDFPKYNKYFSIESPLNIDIEQTSQQIHFSNQMINYKKLIYCGQFCFACTLK